MEFGATFSHRHLLFLRLDPQEAIRAYALLDLPWIRLSCYWDEIEPQPGVFSFVHIDPLLAYCDTHGIRVALTIGIKAPRYPEFYLPSWLKGEIPFGYRSVITPQHERLFAATRSFLTATIRHVRSYRSIRVYQIENEPLDPSGAHALALSADFVKEEIALVRSLDPNRNILTTVWGNEAKRRNAWQQLAHYSDIVGLDIYYRQAVSFFHLARTHIGPVDSTSETRDIITRMRNLRKTVWISELQAEPWEHNTLVPKHPRPPSFLPEHADDTIGRAAGLFPSVVLLWGFEWWYYRKTEGDASYWQSIATAVGKYQH